MARKRTRRVEATYKHSTKTKQTGQSKEQNDNYRKAKPPGWRKSAKGWYYEARRNRSDNLSQLDAHNEDAKRRREAKAAALKAAKAAKRAAAKARSAARKATSAARKVAATSKPKTRKPTAKKSTGKKRTTQKKLF